MKIVILATTYQLLSGGDVIFAEFAKYWKKFGNEVEIITNEKGESFCKSRGILPKEIIVWKNSFIDTLGSYLSGFYKTISSIVYSLFYHKQNDLVFISSSFLPDILAAVIIKLKKPSCRVIASQYVLFPDPITSMSEGFGPLKSLTLYVNQIVGLWCYSRFCDLVLTASELDACTILSKYETDNYQICAIRGGVDLRLIESIKSQRKKFDAVYFGRLHQRKNVLGLLDIWSEVLKKIPQAKLLFLGGGPLETALMDKARRLLIDNSIQITGTIDVHQKYRLLKSALIFISASLFDTGNIALDETLACGVPGVIYDLPHMNYPTGVIKVKRGNQKQFAVEVVKLLIDREKIKQLGRKGKLFIEKYTWEDVSRNIIRHVSQEL